MRDAANALFRTLAPRWRNLGLPSWSGAISISADAVLASWSRRETVDFEGVSFSFRIGPRTLGATHLEKFAAFVEDADGIQTPLRLICRAFAGELGVDKAIYLPDSTYPVSCATNLVEAGLSFDAIAARVRDDFGPPAATIAAILTQDQEGWSVDGYFIDDFKDL